MAILVLDSVSAGRDWLPDVPRPLFGRGGLYVPNAQQGKRAVFDHTGGGMNGSNTDDREEKLLAELKAIERWDRDYNLHSQHDRLEQDAHQHRQERRREIMAQIPRTGAGQRCLGPDVSTTSDVHL